MIVMKFGGTSVGNAERIHQLIDIVKDRSKEDQVVVVVSAMAGITNLLEEACHKAANKNEGYRTSLDIIIRKHEECIGSIPFTPAISADLIDQIRDPLHRLGVICRGLSLVGDLTDKTKAHIMSFGELLSHKIVHAAMQLQGLDSSIIDSRDVIVTDDEYMSARVILMKRINESENVSMIRLAFSLLPDILQRVTKVKFPRWVAAVLIIRRQFLREHWMHRVWKYGLMSMG